MLGRKRTESDGEARTKWTRDSVATDLSTGGGRDGVVCQQTSTSKRGLWMASPDFSPEAFGDRAERWRQSANAPLDSD